MKCSQTGTFRHGNLICKTQIFLNKSLLTLSSWIQPQRNLENKNFSNIVGNLHWNYLHRVDKTSFFAKAWLERKRLRDLKVKTAALSSLASEAKTLRDESDEARVRTQIIINPRHEDDEDDEIQVYPPVQIFWSFTSIFSSSFSSMTVELLIGIIIINSSCPSLIKTTNSPGSRDSGLWCEVQWPEAREAEPGHFQNTPGGGGHKVHM